MIHVGIFYALGNMQVPGTNTNNQERMTNQSIDKYIKQPAQIHNHATQSSN